MRWFHVALRTALSLGLALVALTTVGMQNTEAESPRVPSGMNVVLEPRPKALPPLHFSDGAGRPVSLADFRGKLILLNIWATWCPGCREEIGSLDRLEAKLGGPKFQIVAIAVDQGGAPTVRGFFSKVNVRALKVYLNPSISVPNKLGVFGIPTSFLVNARGQEVGKILGPATWDRPAVIDWLRHYLPKAHRAVKTHAATQNEETVGETAQAK